MTAESKTIWKTVGITAGVILIIGAIVIIVIQRRKRNEELEDIDYAPEKSSGSSSSGSSVNNSGFTTEEVKRMQSWLVKIATMWQNSVIVNAIQSTGGIDGKLGSGFNKALAEAIRVKYVTDIHDLYVQAKNSTLL